MMVVAIVKIWLCETALANDEAHLVHFFGSSVIPHFHSRQPSPSPRRWPEEDVDVGET